MKCKFHEGDTVILVDPGEEPFLYGFNEEYMTKLCGEPIELGEALGEDDDNPDGFLVYDQETGYTFSWDVHFIDEYDPSKDVATEDFNSLFD